MVCLQTQASSGHTVADAFKNSDTVIAVVRFYEKELKWEDNLFYCMGRFPSILKDP